MLIEVKAKATMIIDGKDKKRNFSFLCDEQVFGRAELSVMEYFGPMMAAHDVTDYDIQLLRIAPIKEIYTSFNGENQYIATLKDTFENDNGELKSVRYKILLNADSLTDASTNVMSIQRSGYDMQIESIKETQYIILKPLA